MRGITAHEARVLEASAPWSSVVQTSDDPDFATDEICAERLARRGLLETRDDGFDDEGTHWINYDLTPLGELALRIHRALALML